MISRKERELILDTVDIATGYVASMERLIAAYRDLTYATHVATGQTVAWGRVKAKFEKWAEETRETYEGRHRKALKKRLGRGKVHQ